MKYNIRFGKHDLEKQMRLAQGLKILSIILVLYIESREEGRIGYQMVELCDCTGGT
jgi:hypothetical protein